MQTQLLRMVKMFAMRSNFHQSTCIGTLKNLDGLQTQIINEKMDT